MTSVCCAGFGRRPWQTTRSVKHSCSRGTPRLFVSHYRALLRLCPRRHMSSPIRVGHGASSERRAIILGELARPSLRCQGSFHGSSEAMHIIVLTKPPATQGFSHLLYDLVMSSVVPASPLAIVSVWVGQRRFLNELCFYLWASRAVIWAQHVAAGFVAEPGPDISVFFCVF